MRQAILEVRVRKVQEVRKDQLVHRDQQEIRDHKVVLVCWDQKDLLERLGQRVLLEIQDVLVLMVLRDLKETQVSLREAE